MAKVVGVPLLAQLPIGPELTRLCDEGNIERCGAKVLSSLAESFLQAIFDEAKHGYLRKVHHDGK